MIDALIGALIGLAALFGALAAAFFAGGRKQKAKDKLEHENRRKATEGRIRHAIDFVDDDDWRGKLHKRK